jgi:hypothetical protein
MEMIKRVIVLSVLTVIPVILSAQGRIVTGMITDTRGVPIVGPTVCQVNTSNCTTADRNGTFHLLLQDNGEKSLKVECLGFNPVEVVLDESTVYPLKITLTPMYIPGDMFSDYGNKGVYGITALSSLNIDAFFTDFTQFSSSIGSYNTDLMYYFAVAGPEFGVCFSKFYTGLGMSLGYNYRDKYDTLVIDLNTTSYYLTLGYDIISSKRVRVTPMVYLRWLRFRLLNYANERKITLSQYIDERDLDLRFNQALAVAGLDFEYLIYTKIPGGGDYWSLGMFGGYAMKINQKPLVYSRGNRIMTEDRIGLKHLTFGLSVTFYTSGTK